MPNRSLENSEEVSVDLYLFGCGHGDTILVRLPGPMWILVDCCLPRHNGLFDAFLEFLDGLGVRRLDWVFLTHPDNDHFLGMRELLEHFTRDGRSVGRWLSSSVNAHDFRALAFPDSGTKRRYAELQILVSQLSREGLIRREFVLDSNRATSPTGYQGRIELFPIAPSAQTIYSSAAHGVPAVVADATSSIEANALSIVLVLSLRDEGSSCNVLLTGDAAPRELIPALENGRIGDRIRSAPDIQRRENPASWFNQFALC